MSQILTKALLELADDHLILGHRLSEWCGHAPLLEEDLALPNMGLDLIGTARSLYTMPARLKIKINLKMILRSLETNVNMLIVYLLKDQILILLIPF